MTPHETTDAGDMDWATAKQVLQQWMTVNGDAHWERLRSAMSVALYLAEVAGGGEPLPHSDRQLLQDLWVLFTSTPEEIARRFGESACTDDHTRINYALELMSGQVYESRSPDGDGPNNAGATAAAVPCPEARVTSVTAGRDLWPLLGSNTAGSEPADSLSPLAAGGGKPLALQVRALVEEWNARADDVWTKRYQPERRQLLQSCSKELTALLSARPEEP